MVVMIKRYLWTLATNIATTNSLFSMFTSLISCSRWGHHESLPRPQQRLDCSLSPPSHDRGATAPLRLPYASLQQRGAVLVALEAGWPHTTEGLFRTSPGNCGRRILDHRGGGGPCCGACLERGGVGQHVSVSWHHHHHHHRYRCCAQSYSFCRIPVSSYFCLAGTYEMREVCLPR